MPSTDRRLELKEKTSMAQNAWQASVYADGLSIQVTNISVSAKKNIGIQSSIFKPRNMSETW